MVTQYVEYVKSLGKSTGPGIDVKVTKTRRTDTRANRRAYSAGVAIIDRLEGEILYLTDAYEAQFNVRKPNNPSRTLDPSVHKIVKRPNSQVAIANPTLTGITEAEYQAVVERYEQKHRASA